VALAGLGGLPDTLLFRSVIVRMRKRAPTEPVEPYRRRVHAPEGERLAARLGAWAGFRKVKLADARPDMPKGIEDRDADIWESLLAIADEAGETWPDRARVAAVALVADSKEDTPSLGVALLSDLRDVFGGDDLMPTEQILLRLHGLKESPWGDLNGKPLTNRGLANRLRPYGVKSVGVRLGDWTGRGYRREDLHDPWLRYLPSMEPKNV
jgi:hypothetical protein